MKEATKQAQQAADRLRQETGALFVVVLLCDGQTSYIGAHVPEVAILRKLLAGALQGVDGGTARIIDCRKGGP